MHLAWPAGCDNYACIGRIWEAYSFMLYGLPGDVVTSIVHFYVFDPFINSLTDDKLITSVGGVDKTTVDSQQPITSSKAEHFQ